MDEIEISPVPAAFSSKVRPPGSKSITNRALVLAALAQGETQLDGVLFADDSRQMMRALAAVGYALAVDEIRKRATVSGRGHDIPQGAGQVLDCGNSGTTIRFLAAMLALGQGDYLLDGIARMRERPIGQLVDQLRALGAEILYESREGFPPIRIRGRGLSGGGCQFADAKSSQYISAVLMAAPYADEPVAVNLLGAITSEPYVVMTLRMMEQYSIHAQVHDQCGQTVSRAIQVPNGLYRPPAGGVYPIEPDASNASYFLAAAAIIPGASITVQGLGKNSLQGDVAFADVLAKMGATVEWQNDPAPSITVRAPADGILHAVDLDMNHIPDMVQTLAIVSLFADGPTTIRNVWNLRVKETDRLAALEAELKKLGANTQTGRDWIRITPPPKNALVPASIATYDDHRMAMAFAIAGLRSPGIRIQNPGCTAKTYPDFFADLAAATKSSEPRP